MKQMKACRILIRLPFAHSANKSLSFVRWFTKKQTEVIHLQWTKRTCPSMIDVYSSCTGTQGSVHKYRSGLYFLYLVDHLWPCSYVSEIYSLFLLYIQFMYILHSV
jgi:hypothetical protein